LEKPAGIGKILFVIVAINPDIVIPFVGHFCFWKNGHYGTYGFACAAINALIRIYVKLHCVCKTLFIFPGMNAVHRADINAGSVFNINAGLSNYIGHRISSAFPGILDRQKDVCKSKQSESVLGSMFVGS
jgi:hypothetical protein